MSTHAGVLHTLSSLVLTTTRQGIFHSILQMTEQKLYIQQPADHLYLYIPQGTAQHSVLDLFPLIGINGIHLRVEI